MQTESIQYNYSASNMKYEILLSKGIFLGLDSVVGRWLSGDERPETSFHAVILVQTAARWPGGEIFSFVRTFFRFAAHDCQLLPSVGIDDLAFPVASDVFTFVDAIPRQRLSRRLPDFLPRVVGGIAGVETRLARGRHTSGSSAVFIAASGNRISGSGCFSAEHHCASPNSIAASARVAIFFLGFAIGTFSGSNAVSS